MMLIMAASAILGLLVGLIVVVAIKEGLIIHTTLSQISRVVSRVVLIQRPDPRKVPLTCYLCHNAL